MIFKRLSDFEGAVSDTKLADSKTEKFCADNKLDVFDFCLMRHELLQKRSN